MSSNYPDEKFDKHGIPRVAAGKFAVQRTASFSMMERGLAISLAVYVSGDDADLSREQFLRTVISRIEDDLAHGTF